MRTATRLLFIVHFVFASGVPGWTVQAPPEETWMSLYSGLLRDYVDEEGLVDYAGLKSDRSRLDDYASALASLDDSVISAMSPEGQIAFWINTYNGLTLKVIVDHYPIQSSFLKSLRYPKNSIRQISGVWDKITFPVGGRDLTLDEIEHEILRGKFHEPRIHMALVCASMSCPPLRNEPYTAEKLDEQLNDQADTFLGRRANLFIDEEKREIHLSSIFDWFKEDFVSESDLAAPFENRSAAESAVLRFISGFVPDDRAERLADPSFKLKYTDYNWSLNERRRP